MLNVEVEGKIGNLDIEVQFTIDSGSLTALFGPSGAGKTTIINMIAGLITPHHGNISVNGNTLFDSVRSINASPNQRRIGYVFQDNLLFPHLSVEGNLRYGQKLQPKASRYTDFGEITQLLGITDLLQRKPGSLSGGEQKRVALGRALLASPQVLLMDEPLTGLDQARTEEILPFIDQIRRQVRLPIVYVSHNLDEVLALSDQIALIHGGKTELVGSTEDVLNNEKAKHLLGRNEPSTVLSGIVTSHDAAFGLSTVETAAVSIQVPGVVSTVGSKVRLRLLARDVSLALSRPQDISVLNVLEGTVHDVVDLSTGAVLVKVALNRDLIIDARVTKRACDNLKLTAGVNVFALIKSVAVDKFQRTIP